MQQVFGPGVVVTVARQPKRDDGWAAQRTALLGRTAGIIAVAADHVGVRYAIEIADQWIPHECLDLAASTTAEAKDAAYAVAVERGLASDFNSWAQSWIHADRVLNPGAYPEREDDAFDF